MNNKCDSYRGCSIETKSEMIACHKIWALIVMHFQFPPHAFIFFPSSRFAFFFVHSVSLAVRHRSHDHSNAYSESKSTQLIRCVIFICCALLCLLSFEYHWFSYFFLRFAMYFEVALCENVIGCPHYYKCPPRFLPILVYSSLRDTEPRRELFSNFLNNTKRGARIKRWKQHTENIATLFEYCHKGHTTGNWWLFICDSISFVYISFLLLSFSCSSARQTVQFNKTTRAKYTQFTAWPRNFGKTMFNKIHLCCSTSDYCFECHITLNSHIHGKTMNFDVNYTDFVPFFTSTVYFSGENCTLSK